MVKGKKKQNGGRETVAIKPLWGKHSGLRTLPDIQGKEYKYIQ